MQTTKGIKTGPAMAPQTLTFTQHQPDVKPLSEHNPFGQAHQRQEHGNETRGVVGVSIAIHQVIPSIAQAEINLKSCLKKGKPSSGLEGRPRQLKFSQQTEVWYYSRHPLVEDTVVRRVVSSVRRKISAVNSKPKLPVFLLTRLGKAGAYTLGN